MKNWLKVFFIFWTFGLLVFFNSFKNKFLLDDYSFLSNPIASNTKFIFSQWNPYREQAAGMILDSHASFEYYRPMTHMLYDICYSAFKDNFWQYHLLNLFLFVFSSSLCYLFINKVTGNYKLAFWASLFYLIHPINGIIVNYISADVFAFEVIFILGTILLLLKSLERDNDRVFYALSLLFSVLSLFWHESGMMTPFYISTVVLLTGEGLLKRKILYLIPYFLIILSFILFRIFFNVGSQNSLKITVILHLKAGEYLASLFKVLDWYISKLFYPQGIVIQWATPVVRDHIILNTIGLFLLMMLFLLFFIRFAKEKILQIAIIFILIGFIPVSLAAFIRSHDTVQIEPHWFVVSSIGFFIFAAYFCLALLKRSKKIGLAVIFILVFTWGSVSHAYNRLWADQKTYVLYLAQQAPHLSTIPVYLASLYQQEGDFKESRKYYKLALSGSSSDKSIYLNLGVMDEENGDWKGAVINYRKVLNINPFSDAAFNNLGTIFLRQGQYDKAKVYFSQSMLLNPLFLYPRRNLAFIYLKQVRYKKAIDLCLENLDIVKDDPETLFLLIKIFIQQGDLVNLKKYAYRILNFENDPEILTQLGVIMAQHKAFGIALDCFIKSIKLAPDYKYTYLDAGALLANLGKYDDAIIIFKQGASIDPTDQRFKQLIAKVMILKLK